MAKLPLLLIIFVAFTGLTEGVGVLPDGPLKATVNGTVLFTTSLTPTETPFLSVSWSFKESNIITSQAVSNTTPPEYKDRITLFLSTGSLELRSLTETDSGQYSVTIIPVGAAALTGHTTLNIYVPVSNVAVHPKSADVVEFSSVSLSCTATGSSMSFLWLNDTSEVTASDRVHLTDEGSTLTIVNVSRYDQQPFRCHVFNPVSNGTSDPVNITINLPVSNVSVLPKNADMVELSSVSLSCTSFGSFISFLWLNDTSEVTANDRVHLTDGGSNLTIVNVTRYDQQPFRCHAFNPVSNGTSDPVNIIVSFGPENTKLLLTPSQEYFAEGSDVRLFCSTESRPPAQFRWFLNGEILLHTEPELILTNIQMNNTGNYSCQAFNNKTMRIETSEPPAVLAIFPEKPSGCSDGCIAGIVIACCVLIAVAVFVGLCIKHLITSSKRNTSTGHQGQDNTGYSSEDVNYADVHIMRNKNGGQVQLGLQNTSSDYAQVQVNKGPPAAAPPNYDAHMQQVKRQAPQPDANGEQS